MKERMTNQIIWERERESIVRMWCESYYEMVVCFISENATDSLPISSEYLLPGRVCSMFYRLVVGEYWTTTNSLYIKWVMDTAGKSSSNSMNGSDSINLVQQVPIYNYWSEMGTANNQRNLNIACQFHDNICIYLNCWALRSTPIISSAKVLWVYSWRSHFLGAR